MNVKKTMKKFGALLQDTQKSLQMTTISHNKHAIKSVSEKTPPSHFCI
jgi:hypothetical protein